MAEIIFRDEWEKNYKATTTQATSTKTVSYNNSTTSSCVIVIMCCKSLSGSHASKYFAKLDAFGNDTPIGGDPIAEWLSSPPVPNVNDPIAWWSAMDAVGHPLARMALDFLSAPGIHPSFWWNGVINKINSILN
jgi:hypothetical protein